MKRNTIQRTLTLQAVQQLQCHPTAEEVYQAVAAEHPTVSKGTVYRNLNQLAQSGEIRKLETPDGADHFDHCCQLHYHVRCMQCGKVFDVDMDVIPDLEQRVKDRRGFTFCGYDLMFRGVCPACSADLESAEPRTQEP